MPDTKSQPSRWLFYWARLGYVPSLEKTVIPGLTRNLITHRLIVTTHRVFVPSKDSHLEFPGSFEVTVLYWMAED